MNIIKVTLALQTVQCRRSASVPRKGGAGAGRAAGPTHQRRPTLLRWQNDRDTPLRSGAGSAYTHTQTMYVFVSLRDDIDR